MNYTNCYANNRGPAAPPKPEEYMRVEDIMDYCKVTRQTVYNWRKAGKLKTYSFGGGALIRFKRSEVEATWKLLQ